MKQTNVLLNQFLTLGLTAFLVSALSAGAKQADDDKVVGRVGESEVKVEDIRAELNALSQQDQAILAGNPAALGQVVRNLLVRQLVLKQAHEKKWEQKPEVIALTERAKDNAVTESYLLSMAQPPEDYPSSAELQATYDANKGNLLVPKQYRLAQVYVAGAKNADKAALERAQAKVDSLRKTLAGKDADFSAIAKKESDDKDSGPRGGEIGWVAENRLQPEIREGIFGVPANGISSAIRMEDGWHFVKVLEVKQPYTPALEEIKAPLIQQMRIEKAKMNSQAYLAQLLQESPVAINEIELQKVLKTPAK